MYVTLEPCAHQGKTPPCADAIIAAGVARVVIAQRDPTSVASGGSERLRAAGIEVAFDDSSALANDVSAPFRRRQQSGLPWVIAKWAQTLDGRIARESDQPRWISNESSRRMVHRERGRVEAILTGIGTILTDDPLLTVRGVSHRRAPRRIILDPTCRIMQSHQVIETAHEYPTTIVCNTDALTATDRQWLLARKDVDVVAFGASERLPLRVVLSDLARRYEITNLLVEAGEGVLRSLFSERLVNQAWVFVGGGAASPDEAVASAHTFLRRLDEAADRVTLQSARRRRDDLVLLFRHEQPRANWRE
jgi:diaminohydroxyphosphoribosylaminopyrimidine deaminase/5-amino-6-(5-phosphoribosylamino)uracil reductase